MKKWSRKFVLNCQIFNQDTFQKYLKIKILSFHNSNPKIYIQLLILERFNTEINDFGQQNGLFKCIDKR